MFNLLWPLGRVHLGTFGAVYVLFCALFAAPLAAEAAAAGGGEQADALYTAIGALLFQLLAIAIFVEIALTFLFKSRLYLTYLDNFIGGKTTISIIFGVLVVWAFELDFFSQLVVIVRGTAPEGSVPSFVSGIITALIIAGGSSTVYEIYKRFGVRPGRGTGFSGGMLQGQGVLHLTVTRRDIPRTEKIYVELDGEYIGAIEPNEDKLFGDKGKSVNAGAYELRVRANTADGQSAEAKRQIAVDPAKTTVEAITL